MPGTIGFVGLGNMGGPMARRLVDAGYDVVGYDLDGDRLAAFVVDGGIAAVDPAECAGGADVFLTSLPRPEHVHAVLIEKGALGALRPGSTWVDLTTNRRELVLDLAAAAPDGVAVVECPVTGAVDGARRGGLTLFAGASAEDLDRVSPVLAHLGTVIHCGPIGTGNVTKLVTNQLWFVHAAVLGEAFAVGTANGVELDVLWAAITSSVGDSFVARHDAPSIFAGHYDPSFPLELCMKDLDLTLDLADAVGTDLPMTERARDTFQRALDRYGPGAAELHVAKRIEDDAGLSFRLDGDWIPHWEK